MTALAEVVTGEVIQTLSENEEIIRTGLASFVEVGNALRRIRDERLYREAGFETFEEYSKQRWDLSYSQAQRNIETAKIANLAHARGLSEPPSQRVAVPLVKLLNEQGEEAAVDAWERIVAQRGDADTPVTGREVSRFINEGGNYGGKPGWFELLGEVGDTLIRADKQLAKVETELHRKPNRAFREKAGEYAAWAEEVAARLRRIEAA